MGNDHFCLWRRTLQAFSRCCCHRHTEGHTYQLPPRGEIWSRMVSKNVQNNMWGKSNSKCPFVQHFVGLLSEHVPYCGLNHQVIRACLKDLLIPRYKIVVLVHIGQLTGQSMQISSRCLWEASIDTFASYSFKNSSLFGVASVYAVYYEWMHQTDKKTRCFLHVVHIV